MALKKVALDDNGVVIAVEMDPSELPDFYALPRFSMAFKKRHPEARIGDFFTRAFEFLAPSPDVEFVAYELPSAKGERKRFQTLVQFRDEPYPEVYEPHSENQGD